MASTTSPLNVYVLCRTLSPRPCLFLPTTANVLCLLSSKVRLERRRERHAQLDACVARKPGKDDDDPIDTTRIAEAERTMGDYKLKASPL